MAELVVGVREFRNHQSKYLKRVKAGEIVTITERGKTIGRIWPEGKSLEEKMQALVKSGFLTWSGQKWKPGKPVAVNKSNILLSDLVVEDREIDYIP